MYTRSFAVLFTLLALLAGTHTEPVSEALSAFFHDFLLKLTSLPADEPIPITLKWNHEHMTPFLGPFYKLEGTFANNSLIGISSLDAIEVDSTLSMGGRLECQFTLHNVSLTGKFNLTGSVGNEHPINTLGTYTVNILGPVWVQWSGIYNVEAGHLQLERVFQDRVDITGHQLVSDFPGVLESGWMDPELEQNIIQALGHFVVREFRQTVGESVGNWIAVRLQAEFNSTKLLDIVSSAGNPPQKANRGYEPPLPVIAEVEDEIAHQRFHSLLLSQLSEFFAGPSADPLPGSATFNMSYRYSILYELDGNCRDVVMTGLSSATNFEFIYPSEWSTRFLFDVTGLTLTGAHDLHGVVGGATPFGSAGSGGRWSMTIPTISFDATLEYDLEAASRHLQVKNFYIGIYRLPRWEDVQWEIEGLFAEDDDVEEQVQDVVTNHIGEERMLSVVNEMDNEIVLFLRDHLQRYYDANTIMDIITRS